MLSLMMICLFGYHAKACGPKRRCEGSAAIQVVETGTAGGTSIMNMAMMSVNQSDDLPKKFSEMMMNYTVPGDAKVTIELEGNCCWKFYER